MLARRTSGTLSRAATDTVAQPLPSLWALRCVEPSCAREIEQLLDRISELSTTEWLAIGARVDGQSRELFAARERLQILLVEPELAVNAWYVRDLATTCSWRCHCPGPRASRREGRYLAAAREAALYAALAVLARTRLSREDFDVLYAAFVVLGARRSASRRSSRGESSCRPE